MQALVTSASRKLPLLRAVAAQLGESATEVVVVAADANPQCVAAYAWQPFVLLPRLADVAPSTVVDAIAVLGVELLIPTSDADALFFAEQREELAARGVWCPTGDQPSVARCLDKLAFAEVLADAGVPAIPTSLDPAMAAGGRVVVKERFGAGSRGLLVDATPADAAAFAESLVEPVFQPFIRGREVSIDAYRSRDGRLLGTVVRTRDVVVGGESQVTTTVDPKPYLALVEQALTELGLTGHAVLQAIDGPQGPVLVECNPRVGGASTLSFAAGLRSIAWAWSEAQGQDPAVVPFVAQDPGLRLVRAPADEIGRIDP